MGSPYLTIDLDKVEHNARTIVSVCEERGIAVTGVTKGACGAPEVGRAMLRGGVTSLGDSRLENLEALRRAGIDAPLMMLRVPSLSRVAEVVRLSDLSLHSELAVLRELAAASKRAGIRHPVIAMVDLGDLREGVWPDDLIPFVRELLTLDGIRLVGLGANLTCYAGVIPTEANMSHLVDCAEEVEAAFGVRLPWLSGGNSSALLLIASGNMPERINHVRIGEAILLGRETVHRSAWPGTYADAFVLHGEVIERKNKPAAPRGLRAEDAFGGRPEFSEHGILARALVNLGREDVDIAGLMPCDRRVQVLGASSDYLVVDVTRAAEAFEVGATMTFHLNYAALLAAMDSAYVENRFHGGPAG